MKAIILSMFILLTFNMLADHISASNQMSLILDNRIVEDGIRNHAFVFSAQNIRGKRFDLHCKHMRTEDIVLNSNENTRYAGTVVATNIEYAIIRRSPCFKDGMIINCAYEVNEFGPRCHPREYLLNCKDNNIRVLSFADHVNAVKMFPGLVDESLLYGTVIKDGVSCAEMHIYTKQAVEGSDEWKWTYMRSTIDIANRKLVSNHEVVTYIASECASITY